MLIFLKLLTITLSFLFIICRYDGGDNILSYDWCNAAYNASSPDHRDLRPVYCPTDTYKITTEEPQDSDVVNWNGTKEILTQQVYALRYTTVESKKYNLEVDGVFFQTKHKRG